MKYQKFIPTGCRDIEIWKLEVVAKTQFLYIMKHDYKVNDNDDNNDRNNKV